MIMNSDASSYHPHDGPPSSSSSPSIFILVGVSILTKETDFCSHFFLVLCIGVTDAGTS